MLKKSMILIAALAGLALAAAPREPETTVTGGPRPLGNRGTNAGNEK